MGFGRFFPNGMIFKSSIMIKFLLLLALCFRNSQAFGFGGLGPLAYGGGLSIAGFGGIPPPWLMGIYQKYSHELEEEFGNDDDDHDDDHDDHPGNKDYDYDDDGYNFDYYFY